MSALCLGAEVRIRKRGHTGVITDEVPMDGVTYYRVALTTRFPEGDVVQHDAEIWPLTADDVERLE